MNFSKVFFAVSFVASTMAPSAAQARIFNFKDTWVSAYVRGTGGMSQVEDDLYAKTSGTDTRFNRDVDYNFSGEIGFAFQLGHQAVFRLGVEGLQTKNIEVTGRRSSDSEKYMTVETTAAALSPNAVVEVGVYNTGTSRAFVFGGAGYSMVKVGHDYTLEAAATTDYAGSITPYKETWVGNAISYQVGAGWESFIFDNVTFSVEAGWRQLKVKDLTYDSNTTVIRGGSGSAVTSGSDVRDNNGNLVTLDLGGYFVGVMFKFYIPPLN